MKRRSAVVVAIGLAAMSLATATAVAAEPHDDDFASIELTDDDWTWELAIYDGNGRNRRTPIDLPVIGRPALSPDGRRIAFTSWLTDETDGRWGLFVVDVVVFGEVECGGLSFLVLEHDWLVLSGGLYGVEHSNEVSCGCCVLFGIIEI